MRSKSRLIALIVALSLLLAVQLNAGAATKFSIYDLKPLGQVAIPSDWAAEMYADESDMVEYIFYDEYLAERYMMLRLLSVAIESGNFDNAYLFGFKTEEMTLILKENLMGLFALDAEFKSASVNFKGVDILAFTVPDEFFGKMSAPMILYLVFVRGNDLVSVTLIDEYVYMLEDFELYDVIIGDLLGVEDGSGAMKLIHDSINK